MAVKKHSVNIKPRKMLVSDPKKEKVRLAIECTIQERKYMKICAASEEKTLNQFVLESIREKMNRCMHHHLPNRETLSSLEDSENNIGHRSFDNLDDMFKYLDI